jgi:O-antigen/teichoic acid export membrane protein
VPILLWGVYLAVLSGVLIVIFGYTSPAEPALLAGTAGIVLVFGLLVALRRLHLTDRGEPHALPDLSPPIPWIAVAIVFLLLGVELGAWLTLIGAGMLAIGIGGVVREQRAQRRMLERAGKPGKASS